MQDSEGVYHSSRMCFYQTAGNRIWKSAVSSEWCSLITCGTLNSCWNTRRLRAHVSCICILFAPAFIVSVCISIPCSILWLSTEVILQGASTNQVFLKCNYEIYSRIINQQLESLLKPEALITSWSDMPDYQQFLVSREHYEVESIFNKETYFSRLFSLLRLCFQQTRYISWKHFSSNNVIYNTIKSVNDQAVVTWKTSPYSSRKCIFEHSIHRIIQP